MTDSDGAHAPITEVVAEVLSPTAPSQPFDHGALVDLPEILPRTGSAKQLFWIGAGTGAAFALLAVAVGTHSVPTGTIDGNIHAWVIVTRSQLNIDIANFLTWGGATILTLPALVFVGALAPRSPRALSSRVGSGFLLAGVASLGAYVGLTINALMGGERPDPLDWAGAASGPTFPSGHTTMATIFAACCVWALAPRMRTRVQFVALCTAGAVWAVVVGLTRVWLGVHWPSDVLGGWLFGLSWTTLAASTFIVARRRWGKRQSRPA